MRDLLISLLAPLPLDFAVATSGGLDSCTLVAAAVAAGKRPRIVSFTFDDFESSDFRHARAVAFHFDLEFEPVLLPSDQKEIIRTITRLIKQYKLSKKARIECGFPFFYLARQLEGQTLVTGLGTDGHFGLSKKAMIHFREPQEKFDEFRNAYFANTDAAGKLCIKRICSSFDVDLVNPYFDPKVFHALLGRSWDELNKPRQKEVLRAAFPELDSLKLPKHTNLQLGDSQIAERLGATAMLYVHGSMSAIGAYNKIRKQK